MSKEFSVDELTLKEKVQIVSGNTFWSMGDIERAGLPKLVTSDASNGIRQQYKDSGYNNRLGNIPAVCYPSLCACGCSFDKEQIFEMGRALGEECKKRGISVLLGPGLNIKRNPLCGRNFEYLSEDPMLSGMMGAAFIQGVQSTGVAACPKHFAGNNQETRRSKSDSVIGDEAMFDIYLKSFEIAVKEGKPWVIMGAYNRLNGIYCCENSWLLNDLLREQWGFDGAVISDWGGVNDLAKSVSAGLDVEMPGGVAHQQGYLEKCAEDGTLDVKALDRACGNIFKLAERTQEARSGSSEYTVGDYLEISRKMAESSFVLLKNEGMLPLKKDEKILVAGTFAKQPRYQGTGSARVRMLHAETPWMFMRESFDNISYETGFDNDPEKNEEYYLKAIAAAEEADKVVVFAGLPDSCEAEGTDRKDMKLPNEQNRLIRAIARRNKNITVIVQAGAPVELLWKDEVSAIMISYLGGSCLGEALTNVLSGKVSPSGRLAETYPVRLSDTPSYEIYPSQDKLAVYEEGKNVGYRYYNKYPEKTAYPFGSGLSYTSFEYSDFEVSYKNGKILVSCRIANKGKYDSKEVVQIYISEKENSLERRLAAFEKVFIAAGKSKKVKLEIAPEYISEFCPQKKAMILKDGIYVIGAGRNSMLMAAEAEVVVENAFEYPVFVETGTSEKAESFAYTEDEEYAITPNTSLRELQNHRVMKPFVKLIRSVTGKIDSGIIPAENLPDYLMDSPIRQLAMGTNGKLSVSKIDKICAVLNKIPKKRKARPSGTEAEK